MTEWEKFKVAELKEECKTRGIPLTGLKLKQQYIDKLVEYENNNNSQDQNGTEESVEEKTDGVLEEVEKDDTNEVDQTEAENNKEREIQPHLVEREPEISQAVESDVNLPDGRPAALKAEDSQASVEAVDDGDTPMADTEQEAKEIREQDALIPQSEQLEQVQDAQSSEMKEDLTMKDDTAEDAETTLKQAQELAREEPTAIVNAADIELQSATPDQSDESRKRKRRSVTPPPNSEEIQKKAKVANGESVVTKRRSRSRSPKSQSSTREETTQNTAGGSPSSGEEGAIPDTDAAQARSRSPSVDKAGSVEPALHSATRSLYMRNFKRPLNIQSLRSHISTVAQGSSSVQPGEDPIKFWHMNNIRSHAFVTFSSISAASRVRTMMHETRFPDEPQREPLWIDFVPDDKIEGWIEQETGSGSRALGRNSGSRFEVVYSDMGDGLEAVFREFDPSSSQPQRSSMGGPAGNRASLPQRQASYNADPSKTGAIASGIHPDRSEVLPQSPLQDRRRQPSPPRSSQAKPHSDRGTGFKALDELFSSTTAKPKLYFKLPEQEIIDDRLDMIKDLYSDRGASGDPGMKRYTFEKERGREVWIDNGPEFGHGRKGQERLAGVGGRGRGGYRGRGGGGGRFYGGDSYRGGGRR